MDPVDVLAVMAHPDDAELLCGGALIKAAGAGRRAAVLDLTAGEAGSAGNRDQRRQEADAAAAVMGLCHRGCVGLPDAGIENSTESRLAVAGHIRKLRPRVVVTHWTRGRHPDHRVAAELVHDACYLSGLKNLPAEGSPWRPGKVVHALAFREDAPRPTFVVDMTDQMEKKIEALACYGSQFAGKAGMGEVYPAGERPLFDQIRATHAAYGSLIRAAYGEPFWTRETVLVDSLADLRVSTF
jgi:bacillithiol biosynthesis deacetylase BshB1